MFAMTIIQLPSRKSTQYRFNVPNRYLKSKPKYEHDKKYFSDQVKYSKNLGIVIEYLKCINEIVLYEKRENVIDV